jgi:hypothetical protein
VWKEKINYIRRREIYAGAHDSAQGATEIRDIFLTIFSKVFFGHIGAQTNCYARGGGTKKKRILFSRRSWVKEWNYSDMVLRHIFVSVISLDSFESICRLLYFTDNSSKAKCEAAQNHSKLTFI